MHLEAFVLERWQSIWENRVAWNLSESGVHPLRVEEVAISDAERHAVLTQELGYTQTNGTPELREAIATLYPGAGIDQIEVTNGGSEANFITTFAPSRAISSASSGLKTTRPCAAPGLAGKPVASTGAFVLGSTVGCRS